MAMREEVNEFLRSLSLFDMSLNQFLIRVVFAAILIIIGIILGKLVNKGIKKLIDKARVKEKTSESFFDLLGWVIQASIYIIFINIALTQLGIPQLTDWLTSILIIIPAFVGALILIGLGFAVAVYLKGIVEDSKIVGWKVLSIVFFYFILFIAIIYAIKTAFVSLDKQFVNTLIIILTAVISAAVAYYHIKKEK